MPAFTKQTQSTLTGELNISTFCLNNLARALKVQIKTITPFFDDNSIPFSPDRIHSTNSLLNETLILLLPLHQHLLSLEHHYQKMQPAKPKPLAQTLKQP